MINRDGLPAVLEHNLRRGMVDMTDGDREALKTVVSEITERGAKMDCLLHTQDEIVWQLREKGRPEDADRIASIPAFRLTGTDDGLVRLWTGAGFAHGENLIDFAPQE